MYDVMELSVVAIRVLSDELPATSAKTFGFEPLMRPQAPPERLPAL